jgi:hypothetical protein
VGVDGRRAPGVPGVRPRHQAPATQCIVRSGRAVEYELSEFPLEVSFHAQKA